MLLHKLCHVSKQWLSSYFIAPGNHSLVCEIDEIQANFRWKWVVYRSANWKQIFLGWELRKSRKKKPQNFHLRKSIMKMGVIIVMTSLVKTDTNNLS